MYQSSIRTRILRLSIRAAYYGQELLSTFETAIGEVALVPTTGGIFTVHLEHDPGTADGQKSNESKEILIWDRKVLHRTTRLPKCVL